MSRPTELPPERRESWIQKFVRALAVALVTSMVIILVLTVAFRGQAREETDVQRELIELQEQARDSNLAIACVLSLSVDPETGRDEDAVAYCFTQYGLEPPGHPPG